MTDALIPDTALVPADEFRSRLPEGWYVVGYRAEIFHDYLRPERILTVELTDGRVRVELEFRAAPDWEWLAAYLPIAGKMPARIRSRAEHEHEELIF